VLTRLSRLAVVLMSCTLSACASLPTWTKPTPIECPEDAFVPGEPMVYSDARDLVTTEAEDAENRSRTKVLALRHKLARGCLQRAEKAVYIERVP
jgi:hypothetical protein